MRVMALDYGDVRTGVAVSDAGGMLVGYTAVLQGRDRDQVAEQAARVARERGWFCLHIWIFPAVFGSRLRPAPDQCPGGWELCQQDAF